MIFRIPKQIPVRLSHSEYEVLRKRVLSRDGWRCQSCGSLNNLEVHHQKYRSQAGDDTDKNLITLCETCHKQVHRGLAQSLE